MSDRRTVTYCYDGTFDGLMCCVFECYEKRELPTSISVGTPEQLDFSELKHIITDRSKASRVISAIPKKISPNVLDLTHKMFLSCEEDKDITILMYLLKGFKAGGKIEYMLADETINKLNKAVQHLTREAHLYEGFVRFSDRDGYLTAVIEPKNKVIPLLADHFTDRFRNENFLIYDKTHRMALIYFKHKAEIAENIDFTMPPATEEEKLYRELWRGFYDAIGIKERYNPRCRMSLVPKRYWGCMTELCDKTGDSVTDSMTEITGTKAVLQITENKP